MLKSWRRILLNNSTGDEKKGSKIIVAIKFEVVEDCRREEPQDEKYVHVPPIHLVDDTATPVSMTCFVSKRLKEHSVTNASLLSVRVGL